MRYLKVKCVHQEQEQEVKSTHAWGNSQMDEPWCEIWRGGRGRVGLQSKATKRSHCARWARATWNPSGPILMKDRPHLIHASVSYLAPARCSQETGRHMRCRGVGATIGEVHLGLQIPAA